MKFDNAERFTLQEMLTETDIDKVEQLITEENNIELIKYLLFDVACMNDLEQQDEEIDSLETRVEELETENENLAEELNSIELEKEKLTWANNKLEKQINDLTRQLEDFQH